tara:strand:+ start:10831 stop:11781 length:951 start_codon:yes stop_codon:yes gene_type:complete
MKKSKLITILMPTYNEKDNIQKIINEIKLKITKLKIKYDFEILIIDNNSNDGTQQILKEMAKLDKEIKLIFNLKNFGHTRSPFYGLLQSKGDAVILMSSDFQDPPELISKYISEWEKGSLVVLGKKINSEENIVMKIIRKSYYYFLNLISYNNLTRDTTGAGLYDSFIIDKFKKISDSFPYLRGLISEFYDDIKTIDFIQPKRKAGKTKNNLFTLYDLAILGIVKHSTIPLRVLVFIGFFSSLISFSVSVFFLFYKLFYWYSFDFGLAPLLVGIYGLFSIMLLILGILGEYIIAILKYSKNLPLVVEKERINFDNN